MPRVRRARIPEITWEKHKATIKKLYVDQDRKLEGREGVILHMLLHEGFDASKAQYESRLKRWGFRKNLKKEDWQLIGQRLRARHQDGRQSEVRFEGQLIPHEKVQKETARYHIQSANFTFSYGDSLLKGITIHDIQDSPKGDASEEHEDSSSSSEGFSSEIHLYRPFSPIAALALFDVGKDVDFVETGPVSPWRLTPTHFDFDVESLWDNVATEHQMDITNIIDTPMTKSPSPGFGIVIPHDTLSLIEGKVPQLLNVFREFDTDIMMTVSPCISRSRPLLPQRSQERLEVEPLHVVLFNLIMYLLLNNFAGSDDTTFEGLFQHLRHFTMAQMEQLLNAVPHPYNIALEQSFLTIAIKSGAVTITEILLKRDLDIHRVLCRLGGTSYTPLGLACRFRRIDMVKFLIRAGVDVNRQCGHTAIWHLLGFEFWKAGQEKQLPPVASEILKLLLCSGAKPQWSDLEVPTFWDDEIWLDTYLSYAKEPLEFSQGYQIRRPLLKAIKLEDNHRVKKAVIALLGKDFSIAGANFNDDFERQCLNAFRYAVFRDNIDVVEYFLGAGIRPTERCLAEAVRGNSVRIVHRLLVFGVSPVAVYRYDTGLLLPYAGSFPDEVEPVLREDVTICRPFNTPFAEAIRWRRHDLMNLFISLGAQSSLKDADRLIPAIVAASEVGDQPMVEFLLQIAETVTGTIGSGLSLAMSLATLGGHENIVQMLLHSGVKPDPASLTAAVLVRNLSLLRLLLDVGVSVEIPGLVYFAVRWGNIEALRYLIEAGAAVNEYGWRTDFIEIISRKSFPARPPLAEALSVGDENVIQLLLNSNVDVGLENRNKFFGNDGHSPLAIAVQRGDQRLVRELLARGADPNDPVALLLATYQPLDTLKILIDAFNKFYPAGKKYFAGKALRKAIRDGNADQVRILANHTDLNHKEQRREEPDEMLKDTVRFTDYLPTPLGEAIASKNLEIIRILLGFGGDPNSTISTKVRFPFTGRWTALMQAIDTETLAVVRLLCEHGANVNIDAKLGITRRPLQLAVEIGNMEIVEYLLEYGAEVNAPPCISGGGTALQLAAIKGFVGIAEVLLQNRADINAPRSLFQGRMAFEGAAEHGRMDMLHLLYRKGIDLKSDGGEQRRRAMAFAEENGFPAAKIVVQKAEFSLVMAS